MGPICPWLALPANLSGLILQPHLRWAQGLSASPRRTGVRAVDLNYLAIRKILPLTSATRNVVLAARRAADRAVLAAHLPPLVTDKAEGFKGAGHSNRLLLRIAWRTSSVADSI